MRVKILDVNIEKVVKGRNMYQVATVAYSSNGEARTQKVMSFANPDVFKSLPDFVGKEADVTVTKNDSGYNQWAAIKAPGSEVPEASPTATAAAGTRVTGSNYETREERANKQVYIVKQSSIGSAIETLAAMGELSSPARVIEVAQIYVDYVLGTLDDKSIVDMKSDDI